MILANKKPTVVADQLSTDTYVVLVGSEMDLRRARRAHFQCAVTVNTLAIAYYTAGLEDFSDEILHTEATGVTAGAYKKEFSDIGAGYMRIKIKANAGGSQGNVTDASIMTKGF